MRQGLQRLLTGTCAGVLCVGSVLAGDQIWVSDTAGAIGRVDVDTRVVTVIGNTGLSFLDLAFSPAGELFGLTSTALYRLNTTTAAATLVGSLGTSLNSLVFGSDGTLYGANSSLYRINPLTGAPTLLGNGGSSYSSTGDLAFVGGRLLLTAPTPSFSGDRLLELNPLTGAATLVGTLGTGFFAPGLATPDGSRLFAANGSRIYPVNPLTGVASTGFDITGQGLANLTGAAFATEVTAVPELGTGSMMLAGASILIGLCRRRRNAG